MVEDFIMEEILYREALALGLDRDDVILRRRLRQKMEFLFEDVSTQVAPTDEELQTYLDEDPDKFRTEPRVTFTQVYLSRDRRGDNLVSDAEQLLSKLTPDASEDPSALSDPFMLDLNCVQCPRSQVARLHGAEFADEVIGLELGIWSGPIISGYGAHLVFVTERIDSRIPALEEIRDVVEREWYAARRREANETFYQALRDKYTITVELEKWLDDDSTQAGSS
jgi:hypothetical protein